MVKKSKPITKKSSRIKAAQTRQIAKQKVIPVAPEPVQAKRLPSAWSIGRRSMTVLWQHPKQFLGITVVYIVLTILLVRGVSGWTATTGGDKLAFLNQLVNSSNNTASDAAGAYQAILTVVISLAVIWSLRKVLAGDSVRIRDAFYQGMYPIVPVVLVVMVIGVQLLPLAIGAGVYTTVIGSGIATQAIEQLFWVGVFIASGVISLYLICSSVFALYIATLPNMTPLKALRSARQLVKGRRWMVLRKLLFLPFALLIIGCIVLVPFAFWLTPVTPWLFFLLTMLSLIVINAYLYALYRELIV